MNLNFLNRNILLFGFVLIGSLLLTSCDPDEPEDENEEEVITTLVYTLTDASGNDVVFSFVDLDGDGSGAPVINVGTLAANTSYTGSVEFRNDVEGEDITEEVAEEDDEHQVFYASTIGGVSVAYTDTDGNGDPVGLATSLTTGDAGTGNMTVTLIHEPAKDASGVAGGDISNAGGETDIEVTFTGVVVQ